MAVTSIRGIFLRQRKYGIDWPGARYDIESHIQDYTENLLKIGKELGVQIECKEPFYDSNDVAKLADEEEEQPSDGIVIITLSMRKWDLANEIVKIGKPTVIFTPFCAFTKHIAELSKRKGVYLLSTLDFDSIKYGIKMIKTARQLQGTRIVVLRGDEPEPKDTIVPILGTKIHTIPRMRFLEEFKKIDETEEVIAIAEEYIDSAKKVVEPSRADIIEAAKTYVASKKILETKNSNAITLDCLGLIGAGLLKTTPCLGFSRLCDEGLPAACEADIDSLLTMLVLRYLFDKPSFIGDPTVDTVKNTWINSHCTSATKLAGIGSSPEPFLLRRYGHLDLGVSPQVLWREGQEITLAKFQNSDEMIIGSGKVVGNIDTPPSYMCITSVEVKVDGVEDMRDVEKDVKALHVLLMYENKAKELSSFCQLMGIKSIQVGRND